MRRLAGLVCLLSVLPPSGAWAGAPQAPPPQAVGLPPRDQAAPAVGTSRLGGRVVAADTGQPLRRALVRLTAPEIRESRSTVTAADGQFEFKDLPKGRYTVTASKGSYVTLAYGQTRALEPGRPLELGDNQALDRIDIRLPRGGVITGRVVDEFGEPVADASVAAMRMQYLQGRGRRLLPTGRTSMTNDIGEFRLFGLSPGEYYLSASLRSGFSMMDRSDDRGGYAPTYYPGTSDVATAQRIAVAVGQALSDLTLPLVPAQTATISGVVLGLDGRRATMGSVMALPRGAFLPMGASGGPIRPDGTFVVSGVPPGDYILRAMLPMEASGSNTPASATVTVNGQDIAGVQLVPALPLTASGRIVAQNGAPPPISPTLVRVAFSSVVPDDLGPGTFVEPAAPHDDFTFEAKAPPGRMAVRVTVMDSNWGVRAVRLRGTDVTDSGIDVRPGTDLTGIEVELTNQRPDVSGYVTDDKGARASNYTVVVFPQDRDRWESAAPHIAAGRPDQTGRFRIRTLPAGDYYAVAVDFVEPGRWMDPDFLESVQNGAQRFTLGEAETRTLDLTLTAPR